MSLAVFDVGAALLGACVGSFLNVVIHRLPQEDPGRRSLGGRSRCPHCGAGIRWSDNVPVLGWLLLRGRARCCGERIAVRYPAVELLTAGLFWLLASVLPAPYGDPLALDPSGVLVVDWVAVGAFVFLAAFLAILVACTFIDFDHFILPDALTKPGMGLGLAAGLWPGLAASLGEETVAADPLAGLLLAIAGLLAGGGVTWGIRALGGRLFRREAMGLGDVKFMAMIGAFLGAAGALLTLLLACVFGALVGSLGRLRGGLAARLPFGPYLALGAVASLYWEAPMLDFLFVTWPEWQRRSPSAQWLLPVVALISLVLLFALVSRSRRKE